MQTLLARLRFARHHRWSHLHMSEYLDREMRADESRRVERHMHECLECRALLASLQTMSSALAGLSGRPKESVAGAVVARVHQRLGQEGDSLG